MTLSYRIAGGDFDSAGLATRKLKEHLARIGVSGPILRRAMIASYEAEMNVVIHAKTGTLWARLDDTTLDLEIADEGPGIPNVELALREGWSTASAQARQMGFGAGMGLPNIRRNSDLFEIETRVGRGTRIRSTIRLSQQEEVTIPRAESAMALAISPGRCRRCMRCLFTCPTGAIRIGSAGPTVREPLCVGCTACIGECESAVFGLPAPRFLPRDLRGAVLVVPRGFLAGLSAGSSIQRILQAVRRLGFAEIRLAEEWEAALLRAARESVGNVPRPFIPPLCSAIVALVESRFPSLIPHLGPWLPPIESAGEEFPLRSVAVLASCPSQYAALGKTSLTDRLHVLSPSSLADSLRPLFAEEPTGADMSLPDVTESTGDPAEVAVSGARHVLKALAAAEAGALADVSLLRLSLCEGGCSGSPLFCPDAQLSARFWQAGHGLRETRDAAGVVPRARAYAQRVGMRLDPDMGQAIRKLSAIDTLSKALPGRDCGACGAPGCAAFAEDVVMGAAGAADCPYAAKEVSP